MKNKLNCILLIDDDEPTTYLGKMMVEDADCTQCIQTASGGQEALDFLTRMEQGNESFPAPDLIFLDINMPAMNGWEFLERYNVLEKEHKGEIVMVMLTTSLNPDDKIKANEMPGISGFESKPLTPDKLDAILKKYFPGRFN